MELLVFGTPEGTRAPDLLVRSQSLYPTELPAHLHSRAQLYYHKRWRIASLFPKIFQTIFSKRNTAHRKCDTLC